MCPIHWSTVLLIVWTGQRHDVLQATTVMTEASHSNRFHWLWLPIDKHQTGDREAQFRHVSAIDWTSFLCEECILLFRRFIFCCCRCAQSIILRFFGTANDTSFFITEPKEANIFQQLFWAAETRIVVFFSQFFSRSLFKYFKPRSRIKMIRTT